MSDDDSFTYSDDEAPANSNRNSTATGGGFPAAGAGSNLTGRASRISVQPSSDSLNRGSNRGNSLLVSPRNRLSMSDNDSSITSIIEIPLSDSPATPQAAPRAQRVATAPTGSMRPVQAVNSADITVEPGTAPSAPNSSLLTESLNRMGGEFLRFFGLSSDPSASNNQSVYPTINEPEPPPFTENAANLTRNISTAMRTIRRGGRAQADADIPASAPPSRSADGATDAPPAIPMSGAAVPPAAVPRGRAQGGGDDDFVFYDEDAPPAYEDLAPDANTPPPAIPGRPLPPSVAYRQQMGIADPAPPQRRQPAAGRARRARPAREAGEAEEAGEEDDYDPGMTILRDPKVREQLEALKKYRPYFLIVCTIVQCVFLFYEMYYNNQTLGVWIDPPAQNWMIGPNSATLVKLGALYAPCMVDTYLYDNRGICPARLNSSFYSNGNETAFCGDLGSYCGMGGFPSGSPDQYWRFITAIFAHGGVIHLVFNMVVQIRLGFGIERSMGPIRTIIIYFSSGIFGFLVSALFNKVTPSVGCSGALYGFVAVLLIDLLQNWRLVRNPKRQLIILVVVIIFSLAIGILPYLDNFAHIGGFVMGIITAVIFVPTINFGPWDAKKRKLLVLIFVPIYLGLMACCFFLLFKGYDGSQCTACLYIDCVPFVKGWCSLGN